MFHVQCYGGLLRRNNINLEQNPGNKTLRTKSWEQNPAARPRPPHELYSRDELYLIPANGCPGHNKSVHPTFIQEV